MMMIISISAACTIITTMTTAMMMHITMAVPQVWDDLLALTAMM